MEEENIKNVKYNFTRTILNSTSSTTSNNPNNNKNNIIIEEILESGHNSDGCLICCSAPSCLPLLGILPCFRNPEYIIEKYETSKYVYLREHSIEWNTPHIVLANGNCCGVDPCLYTIRDNIQVIYYDDPMLNNISDQVLLLLNLKFNLKFNHLYLQ